MHLPVKCVDAPTRKDCDEWKEKNEKAQYGDYYHDIEDGRLSSTKSADDEADDTVFLPQDTIKTDTAKNNDVKSRTATDVDGAPVWHFISTRGAGCCL